MDALIEQFRSIGLLGERPAIRNTVSLRASIPFLLPLCQRRSRWPESYGYERPRPARSEATTLSGPHLGRHGGPTETVPITAATR